MNETTLNITPGYSGGVGPGNMAEPFGTAFSISGFEIRWYGLFYALGILMAIVFIIVKLRTFYKIDDTPFYIFIFIAIPVILLGARAWSFVIGDLKIGRNAFFDFRSGGLAIQGGIIFTTLSGVIWFSYILRKVKYYVHTSDAVIRNGILISEINPRKISMWVLADTILPAILIGQALGRWGNFFNHEVYGEAVQSVLTGGLGSNSITVDSQGPAFTQWGWLKTLFPKVWENMWIGNPAEGNGAVSFRIPIFLIESFMNVIGFLIMYYVLEFIRGYRAGTNAAFFFAWTGIVRLVIEIFRDQTFKFQTSIVTSSVFLVFGIIFLCLVYLLFPRIRKYRIIYFMWVNTIGWFVGIFNFFKQKKSVPKHLQKVIIEHAREWKNSRNHFVRNFYEMYYFNDNIVQKPYEVTDKIKFSNLKENDKNQPVASSATKNNLETMSK